MPLIISGHQRSGTTLLRRLCDAHPQMKVANEFGCFADVGHSVGHALKARLGQWRLVNGRWAFDSRFANQPRRHGYNLRFTLSYWRHLLRFSQGDVTITAVTQALQAQLGETAVIGDKLPQYLPLLPSFLSNDSVKVIIIYRDCRDVTSSFLEKVRTVWRTRPWAGDVDTAEKIAYKWVESIELMERLSDQIYIIQYEKLVNQPASRLADLGAWLRIDPAGFNPHSVKATKVGKHQQGLTKEELADVWTVAGSTMTRLGYE
ncbi:hypothetical protein MNBD_CHLOROFLEXI01-616 [hydrothermal vent metagenome]|uniref:Sulfotransferase n=1 Tax=hydrothermal vent metagenome TaxID=652676 RepID=A0A3B0VTW4_9ZZZZ